MVRETNREQQVGLPIVPRPGALPPQAPRAENESTGRERVESESRQRAETCESKAPRPRRDGADTRLQTRPRERPSILLTPRGDGGQRLLGESLGHLAQQGYIACREGGDSAPKKARTDARICTTPGATSPMAAGHCPNSGPPETRERGAERAPSEPASKASSGPPARPRPVGGSPWGGGARHHAWHLLAKKPSVRGECHDRKSPRHEMRVTSSLR